MKDRRKLERFNLKLRGEITAETADQMNRVFRLRTRDISSGGAFFYGVDPLPEGTPVQINLILSIDKLKNPSLIKQRAPSDPRGNIDGDGIFDILDLVLVSANFKKSGPVPWY